MSKHTFRTIYASLFIKTKVETSLVIFSILIISNC
nr:MAG TPA: hypothetical protein [Bacteriophage sp.]DAV62068.1 MAG TPA: hypothetical protein [Caudoviricetes sp.]DAV91381.1 MAG TPA: hypothetical protein [Bacteriophage sp.]